MKIVRAGFTYDIHQPDRVYERTQLSEFRHVAEYTIFGQSFAETLDVRLRVSDARPGIHSLKYTYVAPAVRKIARAKVPPGYVTTVPCVNLNRTSRADDSNELSAVMTRFIRG